MTRRYLTHILAGVAVALIALFFIAGPVALASESMCEGVVCKDGETCKPDTGRCQVIGCDRNNCDNGCAATSPPCTRGCLSNATCRCSCNTYGTTGCACLAY